MNRMAILSVALSLLVGGLSYSAEEDKEEGKPKSAADFIKRGDSFSKDGKFDEAIEDYTKAIEMLPGVEDLRKQALQIGTEKGIYLKQRESILKRKRQLEQYLKGLESHLKKTNPPPPEIISRKKKVNELLDRMNSLLDEMEKQISEKIRKLKEPVLLQSVNAFSKRGNAWKKKGNTVKADADLKIAEELETFSRIKYKLYKATELISALESKNINSTYLALKALRTNDFKTPKIDYKKPYAEAEPKLKTLIKALRELSEEKRAKFDKSMNYYRSIHSPMEPPGSEAEGWKY